MSILRISAGLLILLSLAIYSGNHPPVPALAEIQANPRDCVGKSIELYVETTADSIAADGFRLQQGDSHIWVRGQAPDIRHDEFVSVDGIYQSDGILLLGNYRVARGRRLKMLVSVIALLVVAYVAVKQVRVSSRGLEVRDDA